MRKRIVALLLVVAAAAGIVTATAPTASARQVRIIGCDSLLNWPCPGPMPLSP